MYAAHTPTLILQIVGLLFEFEVGALSPGECGPSDIAEVVSEIHSGVDQTTMLQAGHTVSKMVSPAWPAPFSRRGPFAPSLAQKTNHSNRGSLGDPFATARAQALRPLAWVHIPKAGSSFLNTLYHTPVLCPHTPEDAWVHDASEPGGPVPTYLETYPPNVYCPGSWSITYSEKESRNHWPIDSQYASNAGHFVAMLRQPEQRIISQYNYQLGKPEWMFGYEPGSLRNFAEVFQGCAVKMLARTSLIGAFCLVESAPPTVDEDDRAVQRLQDGFAFVGLTDEWELSVCLFHAMFGGDCKTAELSDMRIGYNRSSAQELYDTSALEGFTDVHDGRLYSEAVVVFESSLQRYGVTTSTCSCP